jgi:sterol desaturase/sphingolipid hydroxylase (fatty acid hydroxylase superfamily)
VPARDFAHRAARAARHHRRMQGAQIIVLATPVFLLLIAVELAVGLARGRNTYRLHDALSSIGLGILSQLVGVFTKLASLGLYVLVFEHLAPWPLPADAPWVWLAGLLLYDLCYYWRHRLGHTCALLWAAHVVHHQSEDYNLSTALRQSSTNWVGEWLFYLPMALVGVPPLVFATVALVDLLYQYWVHTQQIGRLGWFDRWFCAPSNHRVHHAVNERYLDRNYGGILIVWDRLFGTFQEERADEPCVYGTRRPLRSWNPLWANLEVYADLLHDSRHTRRWRDKLRVWFMPPGWRPADVAARFPRPAFDLHERRRYDPPVGRGVSLAAAALFAALLGATTAFLWQAHRLALPWQLAAAGAIVAGLWLVGVLGEGRRVAGYPSEGFPASRAPRG